MPTENKTPEALKVERSTVTKLVITGASLEAVRICTDHMDENLKLKKALSGMLFAFDDGVGRDWSADLLDYARKLTPAAEFKI